MDDDEIMMGKEQTRKKIEKITKTFLEIVKKELSIQKTIERDKKKKKRASRNEYDLWKQMGENR